MQRRRTAIGMVLVTAAILCTLGQLGCKKETAPICRIALVQGNAQIKKAAAPAGTAAQRGQDLFAGDRVITGAKSFVTLKFADTARVKVREDSELLIKSQTKTDKGLVQTSSELLKGIGLVKVEKENPNAKGFEISTPHVVTGVLGTIYGIECGGNATTVACLDGGVKVTGLEGGTVDVNAGQWAKTGAKVAPGIAKKIASLQGKMSGYLADFFKEDAGIMTDPKTLHRTY